MIVTDMTIAILLLLVTCDHHLDDRLSLCRRNMDVEEGGHSTIGIILNVDLKKVN